MKRYSEDVQSISNSSNRRLDGLNIIVVDDVADIRRVLTLVLRRAGAEVRAVEGAEAALAAISAEPPDVILTDLGMPDIDGFGLLDRVRHLPDESGRDILVIALTGFTGASYRERCLAAGFQDYLAKPIEVDVLLDAIVNAVRQSPIRIPRNGRGPHRSEKPR